MRAECSKNFCLIEICQRIPLIFSVVYIKLQGFEASTVFLSRFSSQVHCRILITLYN
jgi:hypothetical protein